MSNKRRFKMFLLGLVLGLVIGGVVVVVISKNNRQHIESFRNGILEVASKGEDAIKSEINKYR